MAKNSTGVDIQCRQIIKDVTDGHFSPVYLLMGDEPYYPELVCRAIQEHCIPEEDKDFNETVCYGADVSADDVVTAARRYPMMSERQLVVVKEAQNLKKIDDLAVYCSKPLESTVLVICMHGDSVDKRKALYKAVFLLVLGTAFCADANALWGWADLLNGLVALPNLFCLWHMQIPVAQLTNRTE